MIKLGVAYLQMTKKWTLWELNPRPFTCEAKIIPLDQAPCYLISCELFYLHIYL